MSIPYIPDAPAAREPGISPRAAIGRLRRNATARRMLAETLLRPEQLILPLFVKDGRDDVRPIASLPGHAQWSVDRLGAEIDAVVAAGIPAVLLFGIPDEKDAAGSGAWDAEGSVPRAVRAIKERAPNVLVIADVCLCEYTSHGHCGTLDASGACVDSHATLPLLARTAVAYADAGVDVGDARALARRDEPRRAADALERTHRAAHAARDDALRGGEQRGAAWRHVARDLGSAHVRPPRAASARRPSRSR